MGGDMYTPVPAAVFGSLERLNLTGVRFNFRGVGRSEGTHDQGAAEILDVQAVVNAAALLAPEVPLIMTGWSWGADLSMMCADPRVAGWVLAAPPLKVHAPDTMAARTARAPKVFAVPEQDQFSSPDQTAAAVADWENARVVTVPGTDHFFGGQLDEVVRLVNELVDEVTA